jgi:hypothetical protein
MGRKPLSPEQRERRRAYLKHEVHQKERHAQWREEDREHVHARSNHSPHPTPTPESRERRRCYSAQPPGRIRLRRSRSGRANMPALRVDALNYRSLTPLHPGKRAIDVQAFPRRMPHCSRSRSDGVWDRIAREMPGRRHGVLHFVRSTWPLLPLLITCRVWLFGNQRRRSFSQDVRGPFLTILNSNMTWPRPQRGFSLRGTRCRSRCAGWLPPSLQWPVSCVAGLQLIHRNDPICFLILTKL